MEHYEDERKFRIISWSPEALNMLIENNSTLIRQGFLHLDPTVRIRLMYGEKNGALFTVKERISNIRLLEREEEIPFIEGQELYDTAQYSLEKMRFTSGRFEIDIFLGKLTGLEMLEIELDNPEEEFDLPEGLELEEVTDDLRYLNVNLAQLSSLDELEPARGSLTFFEVDNTSLCYLLLK